MAIRPQVPAPDWSEAHHRGEAKCRRLPTYIGTADLFFDDTYTSLDYCNGAMDGIVCPRRNECLRTAMLNRENYGVWGGMTAESRLRLRLRYPGMPERWVWHPAGEPESEPDSEEAQWLEAS